MVRSNIDNVNTSTYNKLIGANASKHGQATLVEYTQTRLTFEGMAIIPLCYLSDYFKNLPSMSASTNFEFKLQANIASSNTWSVSFKTQAGATTAPAFFPVAGIFALIMPPVPPQQVPIKYSRLKYPQKLVIQLIYHVEFVFLLCH